MQHNVTVPPSVDCDAVIRTWDDGGLDYTTRVILLLSCITFFTISQYTAWRLMSHYWARFAKYTLSMQAENASRVNSSIHSMIVSPLLLVGVTYKMKWGANYEALSDPTFLQVVLIISVAYFLKDIVTIVLYRTLNWEIFLIHHIIACFPFLNYFFNVHCSMGLYVLSCYMLAETSTNTLNVVMWCRETGKEDKWYYAWFLYTTALLWVVFRFANPMWCAICGEQYLVPYAKNRCSTLRMELMCGYFVNVFCEAVFKPVLGDEIMARWRMSKIHEGNKAYLVKYGSFEQSNVKK